MVLVGSYCFRRTNLLVRHTTLTSNKVLEVKRFGILKWHNVNTKFRENRPVC